MKNPKSAWRIRSLFREDAVTPTLDNVIRVLHVDDDASLLEVSKQILMLEGNLEVDRATSVDEAFEILEKVSYDAIISDYEMPLKNGLEFLKQLRMQKNETPFILFTGKGREEVAMQALNLGADGYFNKQGSPETVYGELSHGIRMATQRKKAERLLKESENQLKAIISNAPIGIATSDANKFFVSANESFCKILGYSEEELKKLTFKELTHEEDMKQSIANMQKLASGDIGFFTQEKRYVRKDGKIIDGKITVNAIRDKEGNPKLFVAELEDITDRKKADLELKQKYDLLESVGENIDAGLAIIDREYNVVWANKTLRNVGVIIGKSCYKTLSRFNNVCPDCGVEKIFDQKASFDVREHRRRNSKGEVWIEIRATPLRDQSGNVVAALELAVPITERKKAEEKTAKDNANLQAVLAAANTSIVIIDKNYQYTLFNEAHAKRMKMFNGVEVEVGKSLLDCQANPVDREIVKRNADRTLAGDTFEDIQQTGSTNSHRNWISVRHFPMRDQTGQIIGACMFATDLTKQKEAELIIKENESRFRSLFENSLDAVLLTKPNGEIISVNPAACKMFGMTQEEITKVGRSGIVVLDKRLESALKECVEQGKAKAELTFKRKDGSTFEGEVTSSLFTDADRITKTSMIIRDITTKRNKSELAVLTAEEKFRSIFENALDVVTYVDTKGKMLDVNSRVEDLLGYKREEIIGKHFAALGLVSLTQVPKLLKLFFNSIAFGKAQEIIEVELNHKNGKKVLVEVGTRFIKDKAGKTIGVVNIFRDLTERQKTQSSLLQSEARLRLLYENTIEGILLTDLDGNVLSANPAACCMFNMTEEEIKKTPKSHLIVETSKLRIALRNFEKTGMAKAALNLRRKDGSTFEGEITLTKFTDADGSFKTGIILRDVTERKKIDAKLKQDQERIAEVNEKLRVVGSLTRHDVINKLTVIAGNAHILKMKHADQHDIVDDSKNIEQSVQEANRIFNFARAYEQLGVEKLSEIKVEQSVDEAAALLKDLPFEIINECKGLTVTADSLLAQLIHNLIDNTKKHARKATKARIFYEKAKDQSLRLIYEDNGVGVSSEFKRRIFEQGFSTGGGTGLGLFLVKRIIDIYGWTIKESGEFGKGARFVIEIPRRNKNDNCNYRIEAEPLCLKLNPQTQFIKTIKT